MEGIALCTRLAGQTRRQLEATSLARTQLTNLVVTGDYVNGDQAGDFGEDWVSYRWQAKLSTWDDDLQQLDVTVFWTAQHEERFVTLSTLVQPEDI